MRCQACHRRILPGSHCEEHPDSVPDREERPIPEPPALEEFSEWRSLGGGGFAHVYAARRSDGRELAVKVATRSDDGRFRREAAALEKLGPPLTPRLHSGGVTPDGRSYLVMDVAAGEPMSDWFARQPGGVPPRRDGERVFAALCAAVDAIHAADILHRDLKPENAFLAGDGSVMLIDFGLARSASESGELHAVEPDLTRTREQIGTVLYMAPEQCRGDAGTDARTDLYALGAVLFELLTGRPPFLGSPAQIAQAHVSRRPPRVTDFAAVPPAVNRVLARALAKDRAERFERAADMASALAEALRSIRVEPAAAEPRRRSSQRRPVALLWVDGGVPTNRVRDLVTPHGGEVARTTAGGSVVAFGSAQPATGVRNALRSAARIGDAASLCAVHVDELRIRSGRRGSMFIGAALDAGWVPEDRPEGEAVVLTKSAAERLEPGEVAPSAAPGLFTTVTAAAPVMDMTVSVLRGRDDLTEAAAAEARACIANRTPAITTIVGERGYGKSRLLQQIVSRIDRADARVVLLEASDLLPGLVRAALGPGSADELRDAATRRLGPRLARTAWPALAQVLGVAAPDGPVPANPSVLRQTLARALGALLASAARDRPLALLVDDAHRADFTSLDAFEAATLAENAAPLWICVVARPQLQTLRPSWGERAAAHHTHALEPLDDAAASELLCDLLHPVEYIPEQTLAPLIEMTGGVPLHLVELARSLRAAGAIRKRGSTGAWVLAADELLGVSSTPLMERLAERTLRDLPTDLRQLLQLGAVLGDPIRLADVRAVERQLDAAEEFSNLDPGVGLDALARRGVLRGAGDHYTFRHPMVRAAIEGLTDAGTRKRLHAAALGAFADVPHTEERRARHAVGCGDHATAAALFARLATDADAGFRYADAEQLYSAALEHLDAGDDLGRQRALTGRGKTRYVMARHAASLSDLEAALEIARARGADADVVELLLEKATLLDWSYEFPRSAEAAEQAHPLAEALGDDRLRSRATMALGRSAWRSERVDDAIELLGEAAERAGALGDSETRIVALTLRGMALLAAGRLDESEAAFETVLDACEAAGDRVHSGANYANRMNLWAVRQDYERSLQDAELAIAIARETGNFQLERGANYNIAELMLWRDELDGALPRARRSRELQLGFSEAPTEHDSLLLARIACARGDADTAREMLDWIDTNCDADAMPPSHRVLRRMTELAITDGSDADWDALLADSEQHSALDERLEILLACARSATAAPRRAAIAETATALAAQAPHWIPRFEPLRSS